MTSTQRSDGVTRLEVTGIDGLETGEIELRRGVDVLVDESPERRKQCFQAVQFALAGPDRALSRELGECRVRVDFGDEVHERTCVRDGGELVVNGGEESDPVRLTDLFGYLYGCDGLRQQFVGSADVGPLLAYCDRNVPLDGAVAELTHRIGERNQRYSRRARADRELQQLEDRADSLSRTAESMASDLEAASDELATGNEARRFRAQNRDRLSSTLTEVEETVEELVTVRRGVSSDEDRLVALREERDELRSKLPADSTDETDQRSDLESELADAREEKQRLDQEIQNIQNLIQFNRDVLVGEADEKFPQVGTDGAADEGSQTETKDDLTTCVLCHSEVPAPRIESGLESLNSVLTEKLDRADEVEARIETLQERKRAAESRQDQCRRLRDRKSEIESDIQTLEERLADRRNRKAALTNRAAVLKSELAALAEGEGETTALRPYLDALRLALDLDQTETALGDVREEMEARRAAIAERDGPARQGTDGAVGWNDGSGERAPEVRTTLVDEYNATIDILLDIVDYDPIERIWITQPDGASEADPSTAPAHTVLVEERAQSGGGRVVPLGLLRESDRDVVALLVSIAGYIVYEVYEDQRVLLLDSLTALEPRQIERLAEYLAPLTDHVVVGLPPELGRAVGEEQISLRGQK
ncbi:hypothetical protein [Halomicrobium salinisoli]|uniref:hypothetical protein n=1 Tax=Halomicrobium salinisoli TaxID=2878391 RepID=UPI001CEFC31B|nr:hypothetical protein [Halomicrobium salinisoli]